MLAAAIVKDVQLLVRDRGALLSLFALPVVFIAVFGSMFRVGTSDRAPRDVALWCAPGDGGDAARCERIARTVDGDPAFRVVRHASAARVRAEVARGAVRVGIVDDGVPVELVLDQGAPIQIRGPLEGALRGLLVRAIVDAPAAPDSLVAVRTPPGIDDRLEGISSFQLAVPGNAVLFGFFLALTVALSFVEERRSGTWRRILAAPVHRGAILVAKLVPFLLLGLLQFGFLFGLGWLAFDMQIGGSLVALAAVTLAVVACATSLGLAIAALGGSEKMVGSVGSICLLVMGLLGGAMVPRHQMPEAMAAIARGVPHAWALDGFYTLLVRDGAGLGDVVAELGALAAFTLVFAGFGLARFRFA
jgi:ABC-type Na+ efflux pump permease subunit